MSLFQSGKLLSCDAGIADEALGHTARSTENATTQYPHRGDGSKNALWMCSISDGAGATFMFV